MDVPETTPWELARARQALAMKAYSKHLQVFHKWSGLLPALERLGWTLRKAQAEQERAKLLAVPRASRPKKHKPPPADPAPARASLPVVGWPPAPEKHERVLELAAPAPAGLPACWQAGWSCVELKQGKEYDAVTDYFLATIGIPNVKIKGLRRLQNRDVYEACQHGNSFGTPTVMFHGCRTQANEDSIISEGFQVSCCCSGGGTWFAYGAAYSNSGFVFAKASGERHIFVCVVSDRSVALDNATMRVVGQSCAYPQWLLAYSLPAPAPAPAPPPAPAPAVLQSRTREAPRQFFAVHNGAWVAESPSEGKASRRRRRRRAAVAGRARG